MPFPRSWSAKKKAAHLGQPHRQKPDLDNLIKALLDAALDDDSGVHEMTARKVWGEEGEIQIESLRK